MRPRILFYSSVASKKQFVVQEFYRTDIRILRSLGFDVFLSKHWYDFLAFWRYDVAFIYFYRFGLVPAALARIAGKGVIFTGGIDYLDRTSSTPKQYWVQALFYNLCGALAYRNIIVSDADLANCERVRFLFPSRRQIVSKHAISDSYLIPVGMGVKEKLLVTIAWMGRKENVIRKGVIEAIEFFRELNSRDSEWRMLIIGPAGEGSILVQRHLQESRISNYVTLTGRVSEVMKLQLLARAQIYVQLSRYEGFGIAAIEALARDCIVLHSGVGGLREGVGQYGIQWNAKDQTAAVQATQLLLADATRLREWQRAGRQHVNKHYSIEVRAKAFMGVLEPWLL